MPRILVERGENLKKGAIAHEILKILRERSVTLPVYKGAAINNLLLPKLEPKGIGRKRRNSIRVAVERLRRQKFIEYVPIEDRGLLRLTKTGERRIAQYNLENLALKTEAHWDKIWRIVMFDIPEEQKRARDALSQKLKNMNFYKLQKSVFVHFLPCQEEIEFICNVFGLKDEVNLVEAKSLGSQETETRQFFKLKS